MNNIKIILVDDHQIILDGLMNMLKDDKNIIINGAFLSGIDALKNALMNQPDIIITDLMMPDMSGFDFIKNLKSYNIKSKVLILSMRMSADVITETIQAGANGFIPKQNATRDEIIKAITLLMDGMDYFNAEVLIALNSTPKPKNGYLEVNYDNLDISVLTKNETMILQLFADGLSNKEISMKLNMSAKIIEKNKMNIMAKLNLKSNIDLIKFAIKNNVCYI
jgi:two-component system, NarL family, nitrate/nitrite response regulator NarL